MRKGFGQTKDTAALYPSLLPSLLASPPHLCYAKVYLAEACCRGLLPQRIVVLIH